MTSKSLLEELQQALKVAEEKESLAEKELIDSGVKTKLYPKPKFMFAYTKAQGFTNGILEAIEITRINERNEQ